MFANSEFFIYNCRTRRSLGLTGFPGGYKLEREHLKGENYAEGAKDLHERIQTRSGSLNPRGVILATQEIASCNEYLSRKRVIFGPLPEKLAHLACRIQMS